MEDKEWEEIKDKLNRLPQPILLDECGPYITIDGVKFYVHAKTNTKLVDSASRHTILIPKEALGFVR